MYLSKILLVPGCILLVSLAAWRWGPRVAGLLAGLPVVAGPILFLLASEHGNLFAADASIATLSAVPALVAFCFVYASAAQRRSWPVAVLAGVIAWLVVASLATTLPVYVFGALSVAVLSIATISRIIPSVKTAHVSLAPNISDLASRMLAGACLTLLVVTMAPAFGATWSGLLAAFPVLTIVLAVFSHRNHGPRYVASLLKSIVTGLSSFVGFCFVLSITLPQFSLTASFLMAAMSAVVIHLIARRFVEVTVSEKMGSPSK